MNNNGKMALVLGFSGMIAGIYLLFSGNTFIGIFGTIASGAVAYKGYKDFINQKKE